MEGKAKLFGKLARVMGDVRHLAKTGRNNYDKYDYMEADTIAQAIGAKLAEVGVMFLPSMIESNTEEYTTQKGSTNYRTIVHMQMTFACADSGEVWTGDWYGEAIDRSDKSISKAVVSAVKYYLLKTFLIAGGDDADADAESPERGAKVRPQHQQPKRPQKPQDAPHGDSQANGATDANDMPQDAVEAPDNPFDGPAKLTDGQLKALHAAGRDLYGDDWDKERPRLVEFITAGAQQSATELTQKEAKALISGMQKRIDERNEQDAIQLPA